MMTNTKLLAALLLSTSLLGCTTGPSSVDDVIADGGELTEPPPEHGPTPVGDPGEKELSYSDGSRWSCKTQKVSLQENPEQYMTLNPNADIIYPGALVQGASLASGSPAPIPVRRGGGTIVLSLVNGSQSSFQASMDEVTQGNVVDAQNKLLAGVQDDAIPAKFVYSYDLFDSAEKLAAAMDVKVEWLSGSSVHAAADFSSEHHYTHGLIRLTQQYFTTTFEIPTSTKQFFAPDLDPSELADYVQPGNPAAYISSVTYGRQFYLVFESESSSQDLKAAIDAVYSGLVVDAEGHTKTEFQETQSHTKVTAYAIGGASDGALTAALEGANSFAALSTYLKSGGQFSRQNPGLPVSYTIRDVAHRNIVHVDLGTEYETLQCNPLVDDKYLALSLDSNKGTYTFDASAGADRMTAWIGDTQHQNEPRTFSSIGREMDAAGRTWARFYGNSYASGIDCNALNQGIATTISVSKVDPGSTSFQTILGGGTAGNLGQLWLLGWADDTHQGLYSSPGQTAFQSTQQSGGQVMSFNSDSVNHYYSMVSNGIVQPWVGPNAGVFPSTMSCAVGAIPWDPGTGFHGAIGEVRIYAGTISAAQRHMVECELGAKWGIGVEGCKDGRPVEYF